MNRHASILAVFAAKEAKLIGERVGETRSLLRPLHRTNALTITLRLSGCPHAQIKPEHGA